MLIFLKVANNCLFTRYGAIFINSTFSLCFWSQPFCIVYSPFCLLFEFSLWECSLPGVLLAAFSVNKLTLDSERLFFFNYLGEGWEPSFLGLLLFGVFPSPFWLLAIFVVTCLALTLRTPSPVLNCVPLPVTTDDGSNLVTQWRSLWDLTFSRECYKATSLM